MEEKIILLSEYCSQVRTKVNSFCFQFNDIASITKHLDSLKLIEFSHYLISFPKKKKNNH